MYETSKRGSCSFTGIYIAPADFPKVYRFVKPCYFKNHLNIRIKETPSRSRTHAVAEATDQINDRWGEFVITPALMMGMDDIILDRISFGGVKELQEIYFDKG